MSTSQQPESGKSRKSVTTRSFAAFKEKGERIAVLTAYDFLMAGLVDEAGIDCVLVGDSLGQVFAGEDSTLPVTLDQMIYHTRAVHRAVKHALLVIDMPFLTYQVSPEEAVHNCGRALKESGAQAVKLEGGNEEIARAIKRVVAAGIPVMGHLGLTPQSVHAIGGYRLVGRERSEHDAVLEAAQRIVDAGCFSMVLEMMPQELAAEVTRSVPVPTIGIGAGPQCDGQVLVLPDMLGLNQRFKPGFLKTYANLAALVKEAVAAYARDVKERKYPGSEHSYD